MLAPIRINSTFFTTDARSVGSSGALSNRWNGFWGRVPIVGRFGVCVGKARDGFSRGWKVSGLIHKVIRRGGETAKSPDESARREARRGAGRPPPDYVNGNAMCVNTNNWFFSSQGGRGSFWTSYRCPIRQVAITGARRMDSGLCTICMTFCTVA